MVLTAVIVIILIGCWLHGRRRGLLGLVISFAGYLLAWGVARFGSRLLGPLLAGILPPLGQATPPAGASNLVVSAGSTFFYNGLAFMGVFGLVTFLSRWLLRRVNWLNRLPMVGTVNGLAGGLVDLLFGYLIIFTFLLIFQLLPLPWWQNQLASSGLAQWIITQTPGLGHLVVSWLS